jgi:hypothetical protein
VIVVVAMNAAAALSVALTLLLTARAAGPEEAAHSRLPDNAREDRPLFRRAQANASEAELTPSRHYNDHTIAVGA